MSDQKYRKFYVDWWEIKKSTVYSLIALVFLLAALGGGGWWLWQSDWLDSTLGENKGPKDAAQIVSFEGDVRIIRMTTRAVEKVSKATYVAAGDTIQTQSDGRAQVKMIDGSVLSVRPNSTVIIRNSSSLLNGTSVRVKLDDGQIRVKTEEQPDSSNNVVEIKESESRLLSQTEASFDFSEKTNVGEIRINRGGIESKIGGEKNLLKEDEYIAFSNNKIDTREKLLKPPALLDPAASAQISAKGAVSDVSFRWQEAAAGGYGLQVASSPFFVANGILIERDALRSGIFSVANLTPGAYFWRVRALSPSGQRSDWSEPRKFTIIKNQQGGNIFVRDWKIENVGGNVYILSGTTKPGATVKILGRETFAASDGKFRIQISTPSATVPVDVFDEKGNGGKFSVSLKTGKVTG